MVGNSIEKSVAICILARDCENALYQNIPKIEALRSHFLKSFIVVVENDSVDKTKTILQQWQANSNNVFVLSENTYKKTIPEKTDNCIFPMASRYRIEKMSDFRNKYLYFLRSHTIITDYIIVIDIDIDDFDETAVISVIQNAPKDWSSLFANGVLYSTVLGKPFIKKYYDTYAFVPIQSTTDELTYKEMLLNSDLVRNLLRKNVYAECISAFAGMGIYKYENIINACYTTKNNTRSEIQEVVCEHISVNEFCLQSGKNYIARDLKVLYKKNKLSLFLILPRAWFIVLHDILKKAKLPS